MSTLESHHDKDNRCLRFRGSVYDRELFSKGDLEDIINEVQDRIVEQLASCIMRELEPRVRAGLKLAFADFLDEQPPEEKVSVTCH